MNRLGKLDYIHQLDEVKKKQKKDFALVGKLGVKQLDIQTLRVILAGGKRIRQLGVQLDIQTLRM